jgi:hypothetical protein
MEMNRLNGIIQSARKDLPNSSKTAVAIDQGASLEEISECAEEEGLHDLASVLFEAEQEALRKLPKSSEDNTVNTQVLLHDFRRGLPANSRTAVAIDQGASLEEISECAEEEGLHELAAILFEAEQESLRNKL